MLNELYSIYKGLEAVGESPEIKHNDIQSPGMGTTFRVMLNKHGQVDSVKLMTREQIQNCWSLGNGNKNQFPAVKVVYPLIAEGHSDYIAWKDEVSQPSEAQYRDVIKHLSLQYQVNLSALDCWPNYRKQVLVRKNQLTDNESCKEVFELFRRYSETETGVEILKQVASLAVDSASQESDIASLKSICTLLFGDDVTQRGEVKDGKRVTLMLDCFPKNDIDIYTSSRKWVTGLSQALLAEETEGGKKTRNAVCALTGEKGQVVYDIFPNEKLNVVGKTTLFAKNDTTSGPTVKRYYTAGGDAFSVSDKLSQKLAASLAFINAEKYKNSIWSKLPSTTGAPPSLLVAFCKADLGLPITPLITGVTEKSDVEDFEDYVDATESVLMSFNGRNLSLDTSVDFTEIIILDKANRKINFNTTANIGQLKQAVNQWEQACHNSPSFQLKVLVRKEKVFSSPWAISPKQVMDISRQKFIRNGAQPTPVTSISFSDVMRLFLGSPNRSLAMHCLRRINEQYQPLLNYCALQRLQWVLGVKADFKSNSQALSAVTLIALLLFNIGRTKEIYMNDFAFQLGQLCSAMDELHIGYCKSERKGDIPNTLLGNQIYGMALQDPVKAMAVMASRRKPYDSWVKRIKYQKNKSEEKAIVAAIYAQSWMSKQASSIKEYLSSHSIDKTDAYKAELMLGYLAGRPFEPKNTSTKATDNQGENS